MLHLIANKLRPNQVQQGSQTGSVTTGRSSSATPPASSSMVPNASNTDPVAARASMLGSPSGSTRVEDCQLSAAGRDISITYNMNCTHPPVGYGKPPGENHLGRQHAKAETRTVDDEGAQIFKNTVKQETTKTGLAGGNINGAIWSSEPEACAIYVRNLLHKGHGWPFYIPGPSKHLPTVYRKDGMRIGDVGIINVRGSFEFLFNICHPANHQINDQGVPKNFKKLRIRPSDIQEHSEFNGEDYISNGSSITNSSGLSFKSSASEGAILAMPVGAISEDVTKVMTFKKYASIHAEDWYRYITISRRRDVKNGDLCLVTGYHKTSRWGIATFADSTAIEHPFHLEFSQVTETNIGKMYEWKHSGTAQVRTGPGAQEDLDPAHEGRIYQNQSLFGRMICATLQDAIWNELAVEFDNLEIDGDSTDGDSMDDAPPESSNQGSTGSRRTNSSTSPSTSTSANAPGQRTALAMIDNLDPVIRVVNDSESHQETAWSYHPPNAINKMLLKLHPNARVAITSDNDWISVLKKDDLISPSIEQLCARIKTTLVIRQDKESPKTSPCIEDDTKEKSLTIEPSISRVGGRIQSVDVMPIEKHPKYYLPDGDLHVIAGNTLFRVHGYFFPRDLPMFSTKLSPGQSKQGTADSPVVLDEITPEEFEILLWVFYNPKYSLYEADIETWKLILCLANELELEEVKELAIRELHKRKELPLEENMALYQNHQVDRRDLVSYQPASLSLHTMASPLYPEVFRTVTKHDTYYIAGADLYLLVENVEFRVHRFFFERESCYFVHILAAPASPGQQPLGTADSNPILLNDVSAEQFAKFLWVFYNPLYSLYDAQISEWEVILDLSVRWGFSEIKNLAVRELEKKEIPDSKRIKLYDAYKVDRNILISRYAALCERDAHLTLEESEDIGLETVLMITAVREKTRASGLSTRGRSSLSPTVRGVELHDVVREVFQIAPLPRTGTIQSIRPTTPTQIKTRLAKRPTAQLAPPPIPRVNRPRPAKILIQKGGVNKVAIATPEEAKITGDSGIGKSSVAQELDCPVAEIVDDGNPFEALKVNC